MSRRRHRWIKRLVSGFALAVMAVALSPAAQARIAEDSGIGTSTQAKVAQYGGPLVAYSYQHGHGATVRPDDRAVRFTPQAGSPDLAIRPDDRATRVSPQTHYKPIVLRRDPGAAVSSPQARPVSAAPSAGDGFNWGDAGIGAGVMFGLVLLGLAAGLLTRHGGRGVTAGA